MSLLATLLLGAMAVAFLAVLFERRARTRYVLRNRLTPLRLMDEPARAEPPMAAEGAPWGGDRDRPDRRRHYE